ncbi:MAG: hypothetical protein RL490_1014 [Pseudomonadota bacterium]
MSRLAPGFRDPRAFRLRFQDTGGTSAAGTIGREKIIMRKWLLLLLTLGIAGILGYVSAMPPAPVAVDAPISAFAAGRAMADVRRIAVAPHPTGSAANAVVRAYLIDRLTQEGFTVRTSRVVLPEKVRTRMAGRGAPATEAINIIALRPGRDPAADAVLLMAHYDSVPGSPGAADDAAGVAASLEIARAIPRGEQQRDFVILLTDAEEAGLNGARDFFGRPSKTETTLGDPLAGRTGVVINLESRGGGGRAMMFETGPGNGGMIGVFQSVVRDPAANSLAVKIYELLPNNTDFSPAKWRGLPGFNFAFLGDARLYHSPLATPDALDQGALQHMGAQALDLTRALLAAKALPARAPDLVFSDVLGAFVIAYPPVIGWLVLAAAAGLIVFAARARRSDWTPGQVCLALLDALVAALLAAVLLYAGNLLSGGDGVTNYYDRLAALPRLEVQALLLFAAALLVTRTLIAARRSLWDGWLGLALFVLLVATALQALLPAGAPIFAWPLLLIAIAMALTARARPDTLWPTMVAAVPSLALIGGFAHFVLLGVGISMPMAVAVFAPLVLLLLWPLLPVAPRRPILLAALALVLAAGALALWVRLDPVAPSVPPYSDTK